MKICLKKSLPLGIFAAAVLGMAVGLGQPAQAHPFINPPEIYFPGWVGGAPYQRNIYWNFNVSPVGSPSPSGTPGADYEGYLDPTLRASDSFDVTGLTLFTAATSPDGVAGIGIDNRNGTAAVTGSLSIGLDNLIDDLPTKNIWVEITNEATAGTTPAFASIVSPGTTQVLGPNLATQLPSGIFLQNFGFTLHPNPDHETFDWDVNVAPGNYAVLNTLQIATQSVPEPATWAMMLAGFGALGVSLRARRRGLVATAA